MINYFQLGVETWEFFNFMVTVRTMLYPLIRSFVVTTMLTKNTDTEEETILQCMIRHRICSIPSHIHKTQLLEDFATELDRLRKELTRSLGELL